MRLSVERARSDRCTQGRDRLGVTALPRQRHSQIERCIRVLGPDVEYETKRARGFDEFLLLERFPSKREGGVGG